MTSVQILLEQLNPEIRDLYKLWIQKFYTTGDKFSAFLVRQNYSGNWPETVTGSFAQDRIVEQIDRLV